MVSCRSDASSGNRSSEDFVRNQTRHQQLGFTRASACRPSLNQRTDSASADSLPQTADMRGDAGSVTDCGREKVRLALALCATVSWVVAIYHNQKFVSAWRRDNPGIVGVLPPFACYSMKWNFSQECRFHQRRRMVASVFFLIFLDFDIALGVIFGETVPPLPN